MDRIRTEGTDFKRGKMHGEAVKQVASAWIDNILKKACTVDAKRLKSETNLLRLQLEKYNKAGYEECCGIASGLGMDEEIYFRGICCNFMQSVEKKCTTLGFRTRDGDLVMGKTDDIYKKELGNNILEIAFPDEGYRHAKVHFAGTIWTITGMNECGLSMAMTGIPGPKDSNAQGCFSLDVLHTILPACATVCEAIEHVKKMQLNAGGFSLLLGDSTGQMRLLEKTGVGTVEIPPNQQGFLLHTNHILNEAFANKNPLQIEPLLTNGIRRYENGLEKIKDMPYTEMGMIDFLNDRNEYGAIRQQGEDDYYTDFSILFMPLQKKMTVTTGFPSYDDVFTIYADELF